MPTPMIFEKMIYSDSEVLKTLSWGGLGGIY
jgi:hypothetical protein